MRPQVCVLLLAAAVFGGCDGGAPAEPPSASGPRATRVADPRPAVHDHHSFANPNQVRVRHLNLDLEVSFEDHTLEGTARLALEGVPQGPATLVLDTRELAIDSVRGAGKELQWTLGDAEGFLGAPLRVSLNPGVDEITIAYRTSPGASGLQWLTPAQTAGRRHPFLFSQSQAIHARSWVPLQDTPQVRFTFEATIRTPPGLRAVMGANNNPLAPADGQYHFDMPQPIPSYLLALAVGELEFAPLSARAGIYAEPVTLAAAAAEFADTESMIEACEALFGPYRWGRYDLLILPPSFPFGGMENPRLSFITPTVIAGDRSLVSLIAHELAHSWSGNLVTNATWEDLWLNEGFTVYLEARIMEAIYGPDRGAMEDVLGYQSLLRDLAELPAGDQRLVPEVGGRDPDEAFSTVPYEKGRLLLVYLEYGFGRETFDRYLRGYFDRHAFQSLSTAEFIADLDQNLLSAHPGKVTREKLDAWIYQPGLPADAVLPQSDAFARIDAQAKSWLDGEVSVETLETSAWSVQEWLYFLNNLPPLTAGQLAELDRVFSLTESGNSEIAHSWLLIAIRQDYRPARARLREYLIGIGRRKLIVPLYEALLEQPWGREFATDAYREARPGYHPLAVSTVDALINQ